MNSFLDVVKILDFSVYDILDSVMLGLHPEIIKLNQVEQLAEGIDAKGQKIVTISAKEQKAGNVYAHYTIAERGSKGLQTANVDLNFSGKFWRSFKVIKITGGWLVTASFGMYGTDIRENFEAKYDFMGLTKENLNYLVHQYVFPEFSKRLRLKLKI